jgi:hypothetical protein
MYEHVPAALLDAAETSEENIIANLPPELESSVQTAAVGNEREIQTMRDYLKIFA